jgi:hypothetical protein
LCINFAGHQSDGCALLGSGQQWTARSLLLVLIMLMAYNRAIMGEHAGVLGIGVLGWLTTLLMTVAA